MHIETNNLNPVLSELTEMDLHDLVDLYCFSDNSVTALIKKFGLNCAPKKLLGILPMIKTDFTCPHCKKILVRKILSKKFDAKFSEPFCQECNHTEGVKCTCLQCKKKVFENENYFSRKEVIAKYLAENTNNFTLQSVEVLSLKDVLYLISLVESSEEISFKNHYAGPVAKVPKLAPYTNGVVFEYLYKQKLISISPFTEEEAFVIENNEVKDFKFMRLKWKIHLDDFESALTKLKTLIRKSEWPISWTNDVKSIWFEISILECSEYFEALVIERNFGVEITDNLSDFLLSLLRNYSVSQCFAFMDHVAKETSDILVKNITNQYDVGEYFIQNLLKSAINLDEYGEARMPYHFTMSQLSYIFYYEVLQIGNAGYTSLPYGKKL